MKLKVRDIVGLPGIPGTKRRARDWLKRSEIPYVKIGDTFYFNLSDLPDAVRLAWVAREAERLALDPGEYDDTAHAALEQAGPARRARAEHKAAIARAVIALRAQGVREREWMSLVQAQFGSDCTSEASLKRIQRAVKGVDPINFAPALLDDYGKCGRRAEISDDAWAFFMTTIRNAWKDFPLKQAWRDTRDVGRGMGWAVPSFPTFYRRWQELPEAHRLHARLGGEDARQRLAMPAHRDKTTLGALECVSLDGRMLDFWTVWPDGQVRRMMMLALVDIASGKVIAYELAPSENAVSTVRMIKRTCETYGIFDTLYTDNGSAFAGHLVAGGNGFRFRNGKAKSPVQPMGICKIMGIRLTHALPTNAQAKLAERTFATLSRVIDDRPEFKGAHTGHAPGAAPGPDVVPVPFELAEQVIRREVKRHNAETGRRAQGAHGRSYDLIFKALLAERVTRRATARQLYLAGLVWKPVSVDRFGQVKRDGWIYGGPSTQEALLRYHGKGQILLGRDPDDLSAPAVAYDAEGNMICEGIEPVRRGAYDSVDGIRDAARNRKAARMAVAQAEAANGYLSDEAYRKALAVLDEIDTAEPDPAPRDTAVVAGAFTGPLRMKAKPKPEETQGIPEEFLRNMDTALAARRARGGQSA